MTKPDSGVTFLELVVVMAALLLLLAVALAYSIPSLAREGLRGSVYDVASCLQLARMEAVNRNRECRCVVDSDAETLEVFDTRGTSSTTDDLRLHRRQLPEAVIFARPTAGPAVTLAQIGASSRYQCVFASDGSVGAGQGDVAMFGGDAFGRVVVFGAGGTRIERWDGSGWSGGF